MNTDIKARWVQRLRDPEIKQGKGHLCTRTRTGDGDLFCCLGVLTEIAVEDGVIPPGEFRCDRDLLVKTYSDSTEYAEDAILPTQVRQWSGLFDANPIANHEGHPYATLAFLNDIGVTFAEIADIIEEQL
jgi:hypothetical protein